MFMNHSLFDSIDYIDKENKTAVILDVGSSLITIGILVVKIPPSFTF